VFGWFQIGMELAVSLPSLEVVSLRVVEKSVSTPRILGEEGGSSQHEVPGPFSESFD
jgi:hypothetical protein